MHFDKSEVREEFGKLIAAASRLPNCALAGRARVARIDIVGAQEIQRNSSVPV
jgi:hypothetical protein